jgi:HEAT repeat protein
VARGASPAALEAPSTGLAQPAAYYAGLSDTDERVRADTAMALGRGKDRRAIGPLGRMLREDASATAREAAARALGLIGSPASLSALQYAAQADRDRDVRRSAAFAADVIRANMGR